jgi:predicted enzyme related to lactoylglutathione lyase
VTRATGIGGVFFRARNPASLRDWYRDRLGMPVESWGCAFPWRDKDDPAIVGSTTWSAFDADTKYFGTAQSFMVNFRVDDLDAMLASLRAAGVTVDDAIEESALGRFGWATDPEGNRFELWQPPASEREDA